jgi:hypothetical protein
MQGFIHGPIFPFAKIINFWGNILGLAPIEPRRMPKRGLPAISKHNMGGGIENLHVFFGARVAGARPNFAIIFPLKPRPTQSEGRREFPQVEDPKTPISLWPTHHLPIDLTFGTGCRIFGRPNERSFQLVDVLQSSGRDSKGSQVVDCLRGQNRPNKLDTAGHVDKLPIPCWKLPDTFILKELEVPSLEAPNRERKPKVPQGKSPTGCRDAVKDIIEVNVITSYWNNGALGEVSA